MASAAQAQAMCLQIDAPEPSTPSKAFLIQPTRLASTLLLFWRVRASCVSGGRSGGLSPSSLCSNPLPVPFTGQTRREGSNQRECVWAVITPCAPPFRLSSCSALYWVPLLCTQGCLSLGGLCHRAPLAPRALPQGRSRRAGAVEAMDFICLGVQVRELQLVTVPPETAVQGWKCTTTKDSDVCWQDRGASLGQWSRRGHAHSSLC